MDKKINNFIEFRIDEAAKTDGKAMPKSKEALINVFFETLGEVIEKLELNDSYSVKAQNGSAWRASKQGANDDPRTDFKKMLSAFAEHGWTKKALSTFFTKFGKDVADLYQDGNSGSSRSVGGSAGADIFLYYMLKDQKLDPILAGYNYEDAAKEQGPGEYWIKFGYGYQDTPYGELVITQQFGSVEKWFEFGASLLVKTLFTKDDYAVEVGAFNKAIYDADISKEKAKSALEKSVKFDGHNIIEIDLKKLKSLIKVEHLDPVLAALYKDLYSMGFQMPEMDDQYIKGGVGKVDGDHLKLKMGI